jgi:hypothetical protein
MGKNSKMMTKDNKPKDMSDLIFFAIKATRTTGQARVDALKQLHKLIELEIEFEENKNKDLTTSLWKKGKKRHK